MRQESGEFPEEHISVEDDGHRSGGIQSIRLQTRPHARLGNVRLLDPNAIELPRGRRLIGTYWNNVLPFQRASIEFQERIDRGTQRGDFAIHPDILCFVSREQYLRHMSLATAWEKHRMSSLVGMEKFGTPRINTNAQSLSYKLQDYRSRLREVLVPQ